MTAIAADLFALAQAKELENWERYAADAPRILYELFEHSDPAKPLRQICGPRYFGRALDVGVGCFGLGFLGVHFSDRIQTIDGLDPLPRIRLAPPDPALRDYVNTIQRRVNYVRGMAEAIPAPDGCYDLVACINVVDHAQDPMRIMREIDRVLKPGGIFVFGVSTLSVLGQWKWQMLAWLKPNNWHFLAHPHTYRWQDADALARVVPGEVVWQNCPRQWKQMAGHGMMSFWIVRKPHDC